MMLRTTFLLPSLISIAGCNAKTLDGGSTDGATSSGNGGANGAGSGIAEQPLSGNIGGKPFEAKTIDIAYSERNSQWFLSFDNYENDCGTHPPGVKASSEAMTINIGGVEPAAGTFSIAYGDGHGATMQIGIYDASEEKDPDTRPVRTGTLQLDSWSETAGATVEGAIKLAGDDGSLIEGTFTAKVCPPR